MNNLIFMLKNCQWKNYGVKTLMVLGVQFLYGLFFMLYLLVTDEIAPLSRQPICGHYQFSAHMGILFFVWCLVSMRCFTTPRKSLQISIVLTIVGTTWFIWYAMPTEVELDDFMSTNLDMVVARSWQQCVGIHP